MPSSVSPAQLGEQCEKNILSAARCPHFRRFCSTLHMGMSVEGSAAPGPGLQAVCPPSDPSAGPGMSRWRQAQGPI